MVQYNGASLVPDLSQALNLALGIGQQMNQKRDQAQAVELAGQLGGMGAQDFLQSPEASKQFARLQQLDPKIAQYTMQLMGARDEMQIAQAAREAEDAKNTYRSIYELTKRGDHNEVRQMILEKAAQVQSQGGDISKLMEMVNMKPEERAVRALRHSIMAGDVSALVGQKMSLSQQEHNAHIETLRGAVNPDGSLRENMTVEQRAAAVALGLTPRATGSAAITAATTPGLTQQVAGSESTIQGAVSGAKEAGKLSAQAALKPEIEANIAAAKQAVADASKIKTEQRSNSRAYQTYQSAMGNLVSAMGGTNTGPIAGRLPAMSADAQIAEGAVAAMAPVLKGIFRVAGEGTFTDKDQELLLNMVPTRKDHPEAIKAKVAAIDAIVESKIGGQSASSAESPAQQAAPTGQPAKQGGQLMIDANGNKAIVYPDGTFEEVP